MKGVRIIHDETRKKRYVQIDIDLLSKNRGAVEDYLDAMVIESRKHEPSIPLDQFEKRLKNARK